MGDRSEKESFQPDDNSALSERNSSKENPPTSVHGMGVRDLDIYEVDLDTNSQQSKKSAAISVMRDDDIASKKSQAISVMKDEGYSPKPSGINRKQSRNQQLSSKSSLKQPGNSKDNQSKKSVALSVHPDRIPLHGDSKKSVSLLADPEREFAEERNPRDVALSVNTEKLKNYEDDEMKSIALSMNTEKLNNLAPQRTVALTVTPDKIKKIFQMEQNKIAEVPQEQEFDHNSEENNSKSRKSLGLSISTKMGAERDRSQTPEHLSEERGFKPFVAKREQALSVITHTPTHKEGPQSIALSAISHTPTEKEPEKQSINLSALHLSQKDEEESGTKSYRSLALSAVKVYSPKNYVPAPRHNEVAIGHSQNLSDKSIPAIERRMTEIAIGRSDHEGVADLVRDDKSVEPKSVYQDSKSIGPKSYYQSEKSINPKTVNMSEKSIVPKSISQSDKSLNPKSIHQADRSLSPKSIHQDDQSIDPKSIYQDNKSIDPKSLHRSEKSINPRTVHLTEKSVPPIIDYKEDKSINPMSFTEGKEETKDPYYGRKTADIRMGKRVKRKHKPQLVDHQCQIIQGRDKDESDPGLVLKKNRSNHPYLRDQETNPYKQDTGNQYRVDSRSDLNSHSSSTVHIKKFKVEEDMTIQVNLRRDKNSVTSDSTSVRMDKQIQVRHGEHVELKQHKTKKIGSRHRKFK